MPEESPGENTAGENTVFALPSLGADMDYGSVLEWRVEVGDTVSRGDVIAVVATEKADIDVEIWQNGTVAELLVEIGKEVPVGTPMVRLGSEAGATANIDPEPEPEPQIVAAPAATAGRAPDVRAPVEGAASPRARVLANERGIDLSTVTGTGPGGAVLERDLGEVVVRATPAMDRGERMRHAIAERMAKANQEIPHYHLDLDIDLGPALEWLEAHNEALPIRERVLPAAMLIKATALAAAQHRECNGFWSTTGFTEAPSVDIGVAISLRAGGLVTPVIADADQLSLDDVMTAIRERVAAARSNSLRSSWMTAASLTVTNLGDNGAQRVHGVIFPPQVALVGFGRVQQRPWVVGDEIIAKPILGVSFSGDHRATDGATGSRFLSTLAKALEQPEKL